MDVEEREKFAREWLRAWNERDLDRILSHYTEDVQFQSPVAVHLRGDTVHVELDAPALAAVAVLGQVPGLRDVIADGARLRARADSGARAVPAVLAALDAAGVAVASVTVARPSLDDVYLRYAGRAYAEEAAA